MQMDNIVEQEKRDIKVGSLWNDEFRKNASILVANGQPVGVFNRGVCAIWVDASNDKALNRIHDIKGEGRKGRTLAVSLKTEQVIPLIDYDKVGFNKDLTSGLLKTLSSFSFIRIPILDNEADNMPPSIISKSNNGVSYLQYWDPSGHYPTSELVECMFDQGVQYPGLTSMNLSGSKELVTVDEGIEFSKAKGIPLFLVDDRDPGVIKGSYLILSLNPDGMNVEREGNIPSRIMERILGIEFNRRNTKGSNYPQHDFPETLTENLSPQNARAALVFYLQGRSIEKINSFFEKYKLR